MADEKLTPQKENFSEWYNQVVQRADLADYSPVRGCMVVKPYGWALWENIKADLDRRFKETGHVNAAFPMLIPMSFFEKEKDHVEGFSPELAVVTHGGGQELEEPLAVRPTSETIIGYMYAKWIKSWRDLPVKINQWGNVMRWEMRPRLFLRTAEFYWQEGHTAHATYEEAQEETLQMLNVYADFARDMAAMPVLKGVKSETEKFPGAVNTYSIEAMMGDTKALQAGTSHNLGQNFAKAFDIKYLSPNNTLEYCWTTSWGMSTRMIGGIIMTHGDDSGLVLPPRLAPYQIVIVPIFKNDAEKSVVMECVDKVMAQLKEFRIKLDDRTELTPGFKYHEWELRGVPLRLEIGPKDVEKNSVMAARRDIPGKPGKSFLSQDNLADQVRDLLDEIQNGILAKAEKFRDDNIHEAKTYDDLKGIVENGWAEAWWCGDPACEAKIKADTKATTRCMNFEHQHGHGQCVCCGKDAEKRIYFSKAY
ncbi:MAG: proline--tRNA ligase [Anaerolineaceae bacterium]|nr:proline--tRNA ligase [Anaerolineaceae bacterium]